jgi:hypothetical protein
MTIQDRNQFGDLLNEMGLIGMAAEVGVHRGEFAKPFLDLWQGRFCFLVDPWRTLPDYADPINHGDRAEDLRLCIANLQAHLDRIGFLLMESTAAVNVLRDESLDFLYLDANHNPPFVAKDIGLLYPKVRRGGIFAGHDYITTCWPAVSEAVNTFASSIGVETINTTHEVGGSFWWVKP